MVYYNDNDPKACAWLRELMADGLIPEGKVDDRSILEVQASDLDGFTSCHWFAGIGGWAYALRIAGWPDDRPVWTASLPCQPFSAAGKQSGISDERHLWPCFHRLAREREPSVMFGEQVAGAVGFGWLDRVFGDLEKDSYTCGAVVLGAHSVGAPHIRQRLYWVAHAVSERDGDTRSGTVEPTADGMQGADRERKRLRSDVGERGSVSRLADSIGIGRHGRTPNAGREQEQRAAVAGRGETVRPADTPGGGQRADGSAPGEPGHAQLSEQGGGVVQPERPRLEGHPGHGDDWNQSGRQPAGQDRPTPASGFWSDAIWHPCSDGRSRRIPAEPVFQSVADGLPAILGDGWDAWVGKVQKTIEAEIVKHGQTSTPYADEVLHQMRAHYASQAQSWTPTGPDDLFAAVFLFAALCQLKGKVGNVSEIVSERGPSPSKAVLRALRKHARESQTTPHTSQRWGLDAQRVEQLRNALHELSHEATQCHEAQRWRSAVTLFPLSLPLPGRVGILRGAGNAICAPTAAAFLRAYMETQ